MSSLCFSPLPRLLVYTTPQRLQVPVPIYPSVPSTLREYTNLTPFPFRSSTFMLRAHRISVEPLQRKLAQGTCQQFVPDPLHMAPCHHTIPQSANPTGCSEIFLQPPNGPQTLLDLVGLLVALELSCCRWLRISIEPPIANSLVRCPLMRWKTYNRQNPRRPSFPWPASPWPPPRPSP